MADFATFRTKLEDPKSAEHAALLKHAQALINISRAEMGKSYEKWDQNDATFRSQRAKDKEDRAANDKGQPSKMIVGLTQAQVMTFVAFCVMSTTQNKRFFELEPTGTEDNPLREPMELILERDTRKNQWTAFLVQFFLDIGKFSLGAAEICWKEEYRNIRVPVEKVEKAAFGGETVTQEAGFQQIPTFIGNRVIPISPYRFFPDTRQPLTRYQEGEFCGSEDSWSMAALKSDASGSLFNLDKIPKVTEKDWAERKRTTRGDWSGIEIRSNPAVASDAVEGDISPSNMVKSGPVVTTKLCLDIIPAEFKIGDDAPLGTEKFPVRYILWYANDKTIIRFEEAYYLHGQFPYMMGQFLPDQHQTINEGLADVCDQITNLITWLINAHVTSVRSNIEGKFIVDPAGIDIKSLESRSPYIFLKKNASQTGVDRYIQQFNVNDVTGAFMDDAQRLQTLLEVVTGFSGTMQGQYSQGRRSATQDRVVAQAGSARGKCTLGGVWDTAFEPAGKQMIANNRQEMDFDTFSRILGKTMPINPDAVPMPGPVDPMTGMQAPPTPVHFTPEELFALFHADPITIATSEDFFLFDATLPSEKAFLAQSLQEILMEMLANPQIAQMMGYGPTQFQKIFSDIYNLRGVTNAMLPAPTPPIPTGAGMLGQPPNVLPMEQPAAASATV